MIRSECNDLDNDEVCRNDCDGTAQHDFWEERKIAKLRRVEPPCSAGKLKSYCFYEELRKKGSAREALFSSSIDASKGIPFTADLTITCCKRGKRVTCSYPVSLCQVETGNRDESRRMPPWIGQIDHSGIPLFACCRIQLIIKHPVVQMIAKVFFLNLDLSDMPCRSKTIVRQIGTSYTMDGQSCQISADPVQILQFGVRRDKKNRLWINGKMKMVLSLTRTASAVRKGPMIFPTGVEEYMELRLEMPDNPKYFVENQYLPLVDETLPFAEKEELLR